MIQDIEPKKLYNQYRQAQPDKNDYIAIFSKNKILIKESAEADRSIRMPRREELASFWETVSTDSEVHAKQAETDIYLFCIDTDSYFLFLIDECLLDEGRVLPTNCRWAALSEIRMLADHELCFAVYTAYHLYRWYQTHTYCGRCGTQTMPDTTERMLYCPKCGSQIYPQIAPAVIAAVTNGDKILLTKYAGREYKRYALIAGFTEIGETAEDTVRREVMEEAGIRVRNIRYYKSQPWGVDGNLLLGYFAELDGSDQITIDENELESAEWVRWEELRDMDDSFSLTREMMRVFYEKHALV